MSEIIRGEKGKCEKNIDKRSKNNVNKENITWEKCVMSEGEKIFVIRN